MKKLVYVILLSISILLVLPLLGIWHLTIISSDFQYIVIFHNNKKLFESAAEMLLEAALTGNMNIRKTPEYQDLRMELRKRCKVDSIQLWTSVESTDYIWVVFLLHSPHDSRNREIRYQPQNQFPEVSASNYTKRISENWFYNAYPKSQRTLQHYLIIICPTVFVISVWSVGIVKITKTLVKKRKGRTNKLV